MLISACTPPGVNIDGTATMSVVPSAASARTAWTTVGTEFVVRENQSGGFQPRPQVRGEALQASLIGVRGRGSGPLPQLRFQCDFLRAGRSFGDASPRPQAAQLRQALARIVPRHTAVSDKHHRTACRRGAQPFSIGMRCSRLLDISDMSRCAFLHLRSFGSRWPFI